MESLNPELQKELDELRSRLLADASPEVKSAMESATGQLVRAGILAGVRKVGEPAPDFVLPNAVSNPVRLSEALAHGPVVLTFYRGGW